jgi:hypothetical protein
MFQICLTPPDEEHESENENDITLGSWHDQLKIASEKVFPYILFTILTPQ